LELLEIPSYDKKVSFGIITTNDDYFPSINYEIINYMISNLAPTNFKYLLIPQIKENLKMRYTNILKESGLQRIFNQMEIPELLVDNNIYLNDILQNIFLVIDKNNNNSNNQKRTIKSQNPPIVKKIDTPFIFYLRLNTINTILCLGQYC
jgi:serine protease inhibitor